MKKLVASLGLMAVASVSYADEVTLDMDSLCNGNGDFIGIVSFGGGQTFVRCELPTSIAVGNNTVVLAKEHSLYPYPIVWTLPGIVVVGNGNDVDADPATVDRTELKIEAGAQIAGAVDSNSALVISRGASINAVGTPAEPIVFSSLDDDYVGSGQWGGLVLAGFGESNNCPNGGSATCEMEGVDPGYFYGGYDHLDETMSSGTLKYVVIAEGGHEVATASEINGLTLYAVNDETTIQNIHVHNNLDDGVEFFGGDSAVTNLWLTCNRDDSVDWDEGFRGSLTNVSIVQGDVSGYAFELANNPDNDNATPRALGSISNVSVDYIGSGTPLAPLKLKEGTDAAFNNVVLGAGYDSVNCDETSGSYASSANPFSMIEYGCTKVDGDPAAMDLPASDTDASGFTTASFWSAPSCD